MPKPELRSHIALILAMMLWGSSFVALKVALEELAPMVVIFLRMVIGALGFLAIWPWIRTGFRYQSGDWKYLLSMSLFEPCLYFVFEANGLRFTSAGQAGMITAMLPLMVAAAAWFVLDERNSLRQWFGFVIAVTGVIAMSLAGEPNLQAPRPLLGNALQLAAMICAVGYTLMVKKLILRYSAIVLTALQCFIGVLFFLPLAAMSEWPQQMSWQTAWIIVYLGLVITLGTYGLYNYSLGHLKASVAAGYTNLLPVFALLFSMVLLGERLTTAQWLAIGVIFSGVLVSQYHSKPVITRIPPVTG
ncbi:MAG: DMT family transporter [Pseudohongiellaceae bacterium]